MLKKRLSVVVPAYNSDATICNTLDSLISQQRTADEIIIVDDHSLKPVSDTLGDSYPDVRVIRHEANKGVRHARNTGFAEVTGDYIFFLDADDILCPEFLSVALKALDENEYAGACFASFYKCFDGNAVPFMERHQEQDAELVRLSRGDGLTFYLNNTGAFIPSFAIFRKSALDDINLDGNLFAPHLASNEDFHLFARILAKNEALWIKSPMGVYFLQPNSISRDQRTLWSSRADAVASLIRLADALSLSTFHRNFLRGMQSSSMRRYARILANAGDRKGALRCLVKELKRSPEMKTLALFLVVTFGLQKKKIEYGGAEY